MRFHPHTEEEMALMLKSVGVNSVDELFQVIKPAIRFQGDLIIPEGLDEASLSMHLQELSNQNTDLRGNASFLGAGLYPHYIPLATSSLLSRQEFLTAYTPYQAEIAQGTLKAMFEYQTMMAEILDMDICNASMYDGAHACAEAILMAFRQTRKKTRVVMTNGVHPEYRETTNTYLKGFADPPEIIDISKKGLITVEDLKKINPKGLSCLVVQTPNFWGNLEDLGPVCEWAKANKVKLIVTFNEPLAFALIKPPGSYPEVDIVAGEAQSFGLPVSYGGPLLGVFAARKKSMRSMPGRLAGRTVDIDGQDSYVFTLSTREQHIRREKATSNICTNQGHCALAVTIYLSIMGNQGLVSLARQNMSKARYAYEQLIALKGVRPAFQVPFFNEFTLCLPKSAEQVVDFCATRGVEPGLPLGRYYPSLSNNLLIAVTELHSRAAIDRLVQRVSEAIEKI